MKLWFLVLSACGASQAPATRAPTFELGELTVFDGADAMLKVHADGATEIAYRHGMLMLEPGKTASTDSLAISFKPGPTIKVDGTFWRDGQLVARVDADGMTDIAEHTTFQMKVTEDSLVLPTQTITLAADGTLSSSGKPSELHVTGADTAGKRRVVLTMLGAMFSGDVPTMTPPSTAVSAP